MITLYYDLTRAFYGHHVPLTVQLEHLDNELTFEQEELFVVRMVIQLFGFINCFIEYYN